MPEGTETAVAQAPGPVRVRERSDVRAGLDAEPPLWLQEGEDEDWHEYGEDLEREDMSPFQQRPARYVERDGESRLRAAPDRCGGPAARSGGARPGRERVGRVGGGTWSDEPHDRVCAAPLTFH
ncbi:hypothetical protein EDD39_6085 [Kitasatospora cineracea]|uniref:Uncharacterized protein n=1 Tax=Kitasatospora cineracea TaxID=88074 RepID=A0A8G1UBW3_9ACTN|nr:hypothetical protein EDD39_6085 [Kitasatospora cineracea]